LHIKYEMWPTIPSLTELPQPPLVSKLHFIANYYTADKFKSWKGSQITRYWSSSDRIDPLIQAAGKTCCESHKFINSIWNKKELPKQWKESITVHIYTKGNKTTINYQGISL
jgi:hypothetical protein